MFDYLRNKQFTFLVLFIAGGLVIQFLLDMIYSLIYRSYSLIADGAAYLFPILITAVVILRLIMLSAWLNINYSQEKAPGIRFYLQIFLGIVCIVALVMITRFSARMIFAPNDFIRFLDELIYAIFFCLQSRTGVCRSWCQPFEQMALFTGGDRKV